MNVLTPIQNQRCIQVLLNRKYDHMYVFINCHLPLATVHRPTQTRQETIRIEKKNQFKPNSFYHPFIVIHKILDTN